MTSLAEPVRAVVTLFEGPLSGVRFADIDAAGLSKLASEVTRVQVEVEAHESKLAELKVALAQRQETLLTLAQQALAYARIYAEGDDALTAQLNDITLPRAGKPRKAKSAAAEAETSAETKEPAVEAAAPREPKSARAPEGPAEAADGEDSAEAEAEQEPTPAKPSYARPKLKRKLGRASARA